MRTGARSNNSGSESFRSKGHRDRSPKRAVCPGTSPCPTAPGYGQGSRVQGCLGRGNDAMTRFSWRTNYGPLVTSGKPARDFPRLWRRRPRPLACSSWHRRQIASLVIARTVRRGRLRRFPKPKKTCLLALSAADCYERRHPVVHRSGVRALQRAGPRLTGSEDMMLAPPSLEDYDRWVQQTIWSSTRPKSSWNADRTVRQIRPEPKVRRWRPRRCRPATDFFPAKPRWHGRLPASATCTSRRPVHPIFFPERCRSPARTSEFLLPPFASRRSTGRPVLGLRRFGLCYERSWRDQALHIQKKNQNQKIKKNNKKTIHKKNQNPKTTKHTHHTDKIKQNTQNNNIQKTNNKKTNQTKKKTSTTITKQNTKEQNQKKKKKKNKKKTKTKTHTQEIPKKKNTNKNTKIKKKHNKTKKTKNQIKKSHNTNNKHNKSNKNTSKKSKKKKKKNKNSRTKHKKTKKTNKTKSTKKKTTKNKNNNSHNQNIHQKTNKNFKKSIRFTTSKIQPKLNKTTNTNTKKKSNQQNIKFKPIHKIKTSKQKKTQKKTNQTKKQKNKKQKNTKKPKQINQTHIQTKNKQTQSKHQSKHQTTSTIQKKKKPKKTQQKKQSKKKTIK